MLLAFGEIMMRITPPGLLRFRQALPGPLECTFGGGEANVCGSLAMLGYPVRYLTALPRTPIAESLLALVLMDHALRHRAQCGDVRLAVPPIAGPGAPAAIP